MGKGGWVIGTAKFTTQGNFLEILSELRFGLGHMPVSAALSTLAPVGG